MNVTHLLSGCWPHLVQTSGINGAVLPVYAFLSLSPEYEFSFLLQLWYKLLKFNVISKILMAGFPVDSGPGSSVGIATGYGLDGPGIESRWGPRFSTPVQTGPGSHPASCTMGTGSFPGSAMVMNV